MRVAIIAPCILPVPATKGGAVEELITRIIDENDIYQKLDIDLFTISDDTSTGKRYSHTSIIGIDDDGSVGIIDRIQDKYYRTVPGSNAKRSVDAKIIEKFAARLNDIKTGYDAVIVENMMSTAVMLLNHFDSNLGCPIYFHMHNDVDIYRSPEYIRVLVRHGVQFITVSNYIADSIKRYARNAVIHVLYNGVDLNKYKKTKREASDITRFLYAGRILPEKGVKELTLSFIKLLSDSDEDNKFTLDIIGFSDNHTTYEKSVLKLIERYSDNISWHSRLSTMDMSKKYEEFDVVIFPTIDEEPFGMVALEAMAKGMPLIVTNSGALPEVVKDSAVIVNKDTNIIDGLALAMKSLAQNRDERDSISSKAYNRAHSVPEFDISNYYDNLIKIIDNDIEDGLISVVVPVYNVESYLHRCVDSLMRQTYKNLEIILIDDGSTDRSSGICDEYAGLDNRIRVIHQQNAGLSTARNTGIENATGEYIFFCDSDDYLQSNALEKMLRKLKHDNADIVACGIKYVGDDSRDVDNADIVSDENAGIWSGRQSVIEMMRRSNVCSVVWNKLYKRGLFDGISFPVGVCHEDEATVYKLLYKAGIVSYTPEKLYNYYQRSNSIMRNQLKGRSVDFIEAIQDRVHYFEEHNESELADHSRITLLEWIKYVYRNSDDKSVKRELVDAYRDNINISSVPAVMGLKKKAALLLWKYYRY